MGTLGGTFLSQNLNMLQSTYATNAGDSITLKSLSLNLEWAVINLEESIARLAIRGHYSIHNFEGKSFLRNILDIPKLYWNIQPTHRTLAPKDYHVLLLVKE